MKNLVKFVAAAATIAVLAPASYAEVFGTLLSGPAEAPPNASPGFGKATVDFDPVAHVLRVRVTFSGLLGNVTAAHIHGATATPFSGTAGVATVTPSFTGFPTGVTAGTYDHTYDTSLAASFNPAYVTANGGTAASAEAALFSAMLAGRTYFNIHTDRFRGGEIRGFLHVAPEPGSLVLLGTAGIFGIALIRRRK